jgi:hypothetical protein
MNRLPAAFVFVSAAGSGIRISRSRKPSNQENHPSLLEDSLGLSTQLISAYILQVTCGGFRAIEQRKEQLRVVAGLQPSFLADRDGRPTPKASSANLKRFQEHARTKFYGFRDPATGEITIPPAVAEAVGVLEKVRHLPLMSLFQHPHL